MADDNIEDDGQINAVEHGCCEIKILRRLANALRKALFSEKDEDFSVAMNLAFDILEQYDAGPEETSEELN